MAEYSLHGCGCCGERFPPHQLSTRPVLRRTRARLYSTPRSGANRNFVSRPYHRLNRTSSKTCRRSPYLRSTTIQMEAGALRLPTSPPNSSSRISRTPLTQNLTSSATLRTGTIPQPTVARTTSVPRLLRPHVAEAPAAGVATVNPLSAAAPQVRSRTSMPRTSPAFRSWTARLRLCVEVVP